MDWYDRIRDSLPSVWERWKNVILTTGADGILAVVGLASGVLTARLLLPEGKGILTAVMLWPALFASVIGLGIGHGIIYFAGTRDDRLDELTGVLLALSLLQGGLLALVGYVSIPYILVGYSESAIFAARLIFLWAPFGRMYAYGLRLLHGFGHFHLWNLVRIVRQVIYVAAIVGLWFVGMVDVLNIVWGYLAGELIGLMITLWGVRKEVDRLGFQLEMATAVLYYGVRNLLASLASQANYEVDQAIISTWMGPESLGLYRVALSGSKLLKPLSMGFKQVIISDVSRAETDADGNRLIGETFWTAVPILGLSSLAAALVMPIAMPLMFGEAYTDSIFAAQLLCIAAAVWGLKQILFNGARGRGEPMIPFWCELGALVVTAAALVALLPVLGIEGAAIASLLAYCTGMALAYWLVGPERSSQRASNKEKAEGEDERDA